MTTDPDSELRLDMHMDEIMRRWPQTIKILLRHRLLCVGCPIAAFHTIEDACREHGLDKEILTNELIAAIASRHEA